MTFFGLTKELAPKYRARLFKEIHEIVYHGNGYDWNTVYNFPIWLRKFTYNEILEYLKSKNENKDQTENTAIGSDGLVKNKQIFKSKVAQPKFNPQAGPKRPSTYK